VADSYLATASHAAGAVADRQEVSEIHGTVATYDYQPVAVETHGPLSVSSVSFLVDLGRKISERTGNRLKYSFYSSGSLS